MSAFVFVCVIYFHRKLKINSCILSVKKGLDLVLCVSICVHGIKLNFEAWIWSSLYIYDISNELQKENNR